ELKRDIGAIGAAFIALNGIVGAGIFAMPQALVDGAGAASAYLILIFGAAMVFVALVFAELAGRFDGAGGPVLYADAAFGRFAGFQAGWLFFLARAAAIGANTNAFLTYLAVFAPGVDQGAARLAVIGALMALLIAINIAGIKGAVRALNAVTVLKLLPLAVLVVWGLSAYAGSIPAPAAPTFGQAESVGLLLLYAFVGFEIATITAGETADAKKRVPRALVGTIAAMTLLYFLVQLSYLAIMQGEAPEGAALSAAAQILAGPVGAAAITLAALISIGGNLFAGMITTPRVTYALAEEQSLPRWFGALNARFATPANSILFFGLAVGALAMSGAFVWLAVMSALARMVIYLICTGALVKLRRGDPAPSGAARWLRWSAPALAAGLCVWAMAQADGRAWAFLLGFAALGAGLYVLARWRAGKASPI
ncbi:MAG TPA: APC family permease, partial [Terricaulis sp.]|nr:APC family permease [Terricaulis sp.]